MLEDLNKQQREALLGSFSQDSMVLAGAGSGKTRLITERCNYLLNVKNVEPYRIMCISFTNKASSELKERVALTCTEEKANQIWVGTFHNICIRLLSMYGSAIGLDRFTILDTYNIKKVISAELTKMNIDVTKELVNNYASRISDLKNKLITPKDYKNNCTINNIDDADFIELYSRYQKENLKNHTLDFDDIILYTVFLLKKDKEIQDYIKRTFQYIMVDETQDSNPANIALFNLLCANCNLFIVLDIDQSIYAWRGATPLYFVENQRKFKVFKLEENYRSTKKIVHASNVLITNNNNRIDKTCFTNNELGDNITISNFQDAYEEAEFITQEIKAYNRLGLSYKDFYVLYRTNAQSRIFEQVFMQNGLPYTLIGALSFNERKEIKDCMAFAKIKDNDRDKPSFLRALGTLDGIGKKAIKDITDIYDVSRSIVDTLAKYRPKGRKANDSITFLFNFLSNVDNYDALETVIKYFSNKYIIENTDESKTRVENLNELTLLIEEKKQNNVSFEDFVNEMDLLSSKDTENKTDSVSMLTVHASKGLEAKAVFIAGCNQGIFPHSNSLDSDEELEQERNLMYVAITRAMKKLYITSYNTNGFKSFIPSQFINEIPKDCKEII